MFIGGGNTGSIDVGDIGHSLRFRAAASAYLSRTFGTPTNNLKWTWSGWVKRGDLDNMGDLFTGGQLNTYPDFTSINLGTDVICLTHDINGTVTWNTTSYALLRDPSAYLHIVVIFDTAQAAQSDRVKFYLNGVQIATAGSYPAQNNGSYLNGARQHLIGGIHAGASIAGNRLDGYLSRVCFVDGQALTPASFGYFNTEINEWVSKSQSAVKAVVDAGGTNSFMLDFDNGSSLTTLGYDKSSKGNNWTLNNHSLTAGVDYDWMLDVPGNSYATLNPLRQNGAGTFADGNLKGTSESGTQRGLCSTMILDRSLKLYCEVTPASSGTNWFGVTPNALLAADVNTAGQQSVMYYATGAKWVNGSSSAYGASYTTETIGMAFDGPANSLTFYKANVSQGPITLPSSVLDYVFFMGNAGGGGVVNNINFGQRPFAYTPPTGFKALCQANMPDNGTVTVSGSFTGNASADGPFVWINGVPKTLTINGNAVTFGTHADKTAGGFKLRTSSASYNTAGSNTWTATIDSNIQNIFKWNNAEGNP